MFSCHKTVLYDGVFPSPLFGRFYFMHSLRSKFLPNLKKKSRRFFLKIKKVRDSFRKIFEKFSDFRFFEKFRKFWKFRKISKTWFFENYWNSFENRKIEFSKIFDFFKKSWKFSKKSIFPMFFPKVALTFFIFNFFRCFFL